MTPSAVRAMDKNTNAVANEAWKTVIIHCRTEFIAFIDKTIKEGCFIWNDYTFNDEDSDGPQELFSPGWYIKNLAWGPWLGRAREWAKYQSDNLQERLKAFQQMCAMHQMLFKERETYTDAVFWTKVTDVTALLDAYLDGWRFAMADATFDEWACFHKNSWLAGSTPRS